MLQLKRGLWGSPPPAEPRLQQIVKSSALRTSQRVTVATIATRNPVFAVKYRARFQSVPIG